MKSGHLVCVALSVRYGMVDTVPGYIYDREAITICIAQLHPSICDGVYEMMKF